MKAKDRISAFVCTNATGTANVPMSIIGKSKKPRCFDKKPSTMKYFSQANAWSDGPTFKKWWLEVFIPFIRSWTHLPVLSLMDGCVSHDLLADPKGADNHAGIHTQLHEQAPADGHGHYRSHQAPLQEETTHRADVDHVCGTHPA